MFLCLLFPSLHWICCSRGASHGLASGPVSSNWLSADFDRLIQKNAETTMRGYQKELSRKIEINWAAEPYTLKAFDTYPLACFYLRTKKKALAAWWAAAAGTTKATAISMSRFSGAYCRGFASVAFFPMSCSCGHLVNSRILGKTWPSNRKV